jgi:hypothetical protein
MLARRTRRPGLERLEERLTPAFNLLISGTAEFTDNVARPAPGQYVAAGPGAILQLFDVVTDLRAGLPVRISTGAAGNEPGHITWQAFQTLGDLDINGLTNGSLTLEAAGDVLLLSRVFDSDVSSSVVNALNLTVRAAGDIRVAADLQVGAGELELAADVVGFAGHDGVGTLTVAGGVTLAAEAVTVRGADLQIDGRANAADTLTVLSSVPSRPMNVGGPEGAVAGVNLSDAELSRLAASRFAIGNNQVGDIVFTTAAFPGFAPVFVEQLASGDGRILFASDGVAPGLTAGGQVTVFAGKRGVAATRAGDGAADVATRNLTFSTVGSIGSAANRLRLAPSTSVRIASLPAAGVFLGGLGDVTLDGVFVTTGAVVDVTAAGNLILSENVSAFGPVSLAADTRLDGSGDDGSGLLLSFSFIRVTGTDVTLRGADFRLSGEVRAASIALQPSLPSLPMTIGLSSGGFSVSDTELAQFRATESLTFGSANQTGDITIDTATLTAPVVRVEQSAAGPGKVVLVGPGPALAAPSNSTVTLAAGAGGVEARQGASVTAGTLHLVTAGSVGAVGRPLAVQVAALGESVVGGRLLLSATGNLSTAGVVMVGGSLDLYLAGDFFARPGDLPAGRANLLFRGDGFQQLDAGGAPIRSLLHSGFGTLALVNGSLDVTGSVTIAFGLFDGNGHTVSVAGDWVNNGDFAGTAVFTGAGTQRLSGAGLTFQNLFHTGSGILSVADDLSVTEDFANADGAGGVDIANRTVRVGRAWSWGNTGKLLSAGSTVILTGDENHLVGNTTFFHLTRDTPGTLTFAAGSTQTIAGTLTLNGAFGQPLFLRSSEAGRQWRLNATGPRSLSFLDVQDGRNATRTALAPLSSHDAGRNTGWVFPAEAQTWLGTSSRGWDDAANWSGGYVPNPGSSVTLGPSPFQPELSSPVTVRQLSIGEGSALSLGTFGLTVTGPFTNRGAVVLRGDEPVRLAQGNDTTGGAWVYTGTGDAVTIKDFGGVDYFDLVLQDTSATPSTFRANRALNVRGDFALLGGAYDANGFRTTVGGATRLGGGTYLAGAGVQELKGGLLVSSGAFQGSTGVVRIGGFAQQGGTVLAPSSTLFNSGDWSVTGGAFDANGGTVNFNGAGQTLIGSTTFFHLTKVAAVTDTLTFQAGSTQTVAGKLTLRGGPGRLLSLVSSVPGSRWFLSPLGTTDVRFVDVRDAEAAGAVLTATSSRDSGNNAGWRFA